MNTENEDQLLPNSPAGSNFITQKKLRISYTRDFLLSVRQLDICKKLPSEFGVSILSEFDDASSSLFDGQRSLGGSSLLNTKCSDYGSLLPNRPEGSSSYSRVSAGRWETRSSGSSDKDSDMQSDRESFTQDSGRRAGNQTRRFWQHSEHDGLLGSGAFPRPSGYAGASAQKPRGNGHYQLNRSTEPYQPPRPYKAVPYSRKDTDSFNDETFGSAECSSEDRAEEERKRKASFELMRKEQQKALQEKQKQIPGNCMEKLDADIIALSGNSVHRKSVINRSNKPDDFVGPLVSQNDSSGSSFQIQAPASRPLVPPGFASAPMEKNISMQSSSASLTSEAGIALSANIFTLNGINNDKESRNHSAESMHVDMQNNDAKSTTVHSVDVNENIVLQPSGVEVLKHAVNLEDVSSKTFGLLEANEVWEDVLHDLSNKQEARSEVKAVDSHSHSTSILEKFFGSALSKDHSNSSDFIEGIKEEQETWSPAASESSKFAHWFLEEEKKAVEDFSSRGLLSLIISNEQTGSQSLSSSDKGIEQILPSLPYGNKDPMVELLSSSGTSAITVIPERHYPGEKLTPSSVVLTCADLEQSILAEVKESSSTMQHSLQGPWLNSQSEEQKVDVDDHASQHLLSLLQKGPKESISSISIDIKESSNKIAAPDVNDIVTFGVADDAAVRNSETIHSSEKTLTLEALFGTAFMNELHSVEAPLSVKRGSAVGTGNTDATQSQGLLLLHADDGFFSSTSNEYQTDQSIHEGNLPAASQTHEVKSHDIPGLEGAAEIQLPEEDSLISLGDSSNPIMFDSSAFENFNTGELIPEGTVELVNSKLLNTILGDREHLSTHGLDGPAPLRGPYDLVDSDSIYNHLHGRPSQFPYQMNQGRPLFPHLDHLAFRNPQMKFMGPDRIHHDPHHPFPMNAIPQHALNIAGGPRFDPAAHHPMLQHMQVPQNFPPRHPIQGLPRGVPLSRPISHITGYIPEMNNVHSLPMHNQPPTFAGLGMGMPGVVGGGGAHPEVLERLIEMERRANSKHIHPASGSHIPGIYGPEFDLNFRYR